MADARIPKNFKKSAHIFIEFVVIISLFHVQIMYVESKVHEATEQMNRSENGRAHRPLSTSKPLINHLSTTNNLLKTRLVPDFDLADTGLVSSSPALERVETWCKAYMNAYSIAAATFFGCAIRNARPLTFCENCVQDYEKVINLMTEIVNQDKVRPADPDSMPPGSCMNSLLSSDTINIVGTTNDFINQLWKDSYCDDCFNHKLVNGTVEYDVANSTLEFERKYNETSHCIENFIETPVEGIRTNTEFNRTACDTCLDLYDELNDYYAELKHHGGICMDIVDTMNYTRNLWSKKFKCTYQQKDLAAVLTVTGVFCLLPIVFYSAAKLHSAQPHMKILKQRRMSKSQSTRALKSPLRSTSDVSSQPTILLSSEDEQTNVEVHEQTRTRNENADETGGDPKDEATASASSEDKPKVAFDI
ncbi:osteopetrosis-associated transmembrane protein 1-like [Lineus longissimus]|uniref:osteopetrosis-associated transmembrane protein 1-like n=1 Tax=Lineus longissimus TaxID=88925 RepID=UPI00315D9ED1